MSRSSPASASFASGSSEGYLVPVLVSVCLHALVIGFVVWGWESAPVASHTVTPRFVEAKLVTMKPKAKKPAVKKKSKTIDLTAKKREQQRARDKKKKQQAAAKRAADLKAKQQADKLAADKKARDLAAEKARLEEQRLADEQLAAEQEQLRQQEFADALAEEESLLAEEQDEVAAQSYVALIAQAIERQWSRPPSARRGMKCELQLQLVPTGDVISVNVSKGSGNNAFDRSAEQAVKKVGQFEFIKDMPPAVFERYFRQLTLVFNPQDLRL